MKKIDHLDLSGNSLRTFQVVMEEGSVSRAAERLGVSQSAVSHTLDKLRQALGDPLFVRSGRNITATHRAISLYEPVRDILDGLKGLTDEREFDPLQQPMEFTIAASDFSRDLIFPALLTEFRQRGIDIVLNFIPAAGFPTPEQLRKGESNLLLNPFPPDGPDIYQKRLFDAEMTCFYDADQRDAPRSDADFQCADYVEVDFKNLAEVMKQLPGSEHLKPRVTVPSFSDTARFLRNSDMLTIQLSLMKQVYFQDFARAPLPCSTQPLTMYMAWHKREHTDPAHQWLRGEIESRMAVILANSSQG